MSFTPPTLNCNLCPRLAQFHQVNRVAYPEFHNAPVPSFGDINAQLLVVGLAPGLKGANRTGRPFTGDYAGIILYSSLQKNGFAAGDYNPEDINNNFTLINCRITNAVRCVPPQNKPEPAEIKTCNNFLTKEIVAMQNLKVIVTLGGIAHKAVISAFGKKQADYKFGHAALHTLGNIKLLNSYHTSRYNINTGSLTQAMFDDVIGSAKASLFC